MEKEDIGLRPQVMADYIGQDQAKSNLSIFIKAAKQREEALDHVLVYGPPGLGKTTLANIIANEMGSGFKLVTGPSLKSIGDLAAILSNLQAGDVLFIDEIHRIPQVIEEMLYSAMEDFTMTIITGKDTTARTIDIDLPPFTLIGATTRAGDLSAPLRDRFSIKLVFNYYKNHELAEIAKRTARVYGVDCSQEAIDEIAARSRGTPRITIAIFKRVRDFAMVQNDGYVDRVITLKALSEMEIDTLGLDSIDIKYLKALIERYNGGPVGLEALAATIGEEIMTVEDMYEPFLLQMGFINRTPRGRVATERAYEHLGIPYPEKD